jgi:hypothetical protein
MDIEMTEAGQEQSRARYPDRSGYIKRDGARLYYEVYGAGEPTVLLLPTWSAEHPDRVAGSVFIGPGAPLGALPEDRAIYPWHEELDTDEGWAKDNRHYWLRDYRGFLEFFFAQMFSEPHSTKPVEDCVGWGLETTAEALIATCAGEMDEQAGRPRRRPLKRPTCALSPARPPGAARPGSAAGVLYSCLSRLSSSIDDQYPARYDGAPLSVVPVIIRPGN